MNAATKNKFRRLLLEHRAELTGDASGLENEAKHAAPEVRMPTHMADLASDAGALEESLGQIEVIGDEVRQIDAALARLDEGTYGVCTKCGEKISKKAAACPHCGVPRKRRTSPVARGCLMLLLVVGGLIFVML